ncbi:MAG: hypothetical protein AMJ78_02600 [Omnitrophica WOR_2 bacterium SM23_29]|nr:MAG: hypothetical protein AMJ78_02600 [Omnitrophica WOR_2 bacterium SM23_29]
MKYLISISLIIFLAAMFLLCHPAFAQERWKSKIFLEDFEFPNQRELANNFTHHIWSRSSQSQATLETETVHQGRSSLGIIYKPHSSSGIVTIQKDLPTFLNWRDFSGISVWVYGDASQNEINIKFKDRDNETWRSPWIKVNWKGWRELIFKFSQFRLDAFYSQSIENRVMDLEKVKAIILAMEGGTDSKVFFDDICLVSEKEVNHIKVAGEYDIPANFNLWKIEGFEYENDYDFCKIYPKRMVGGNGRDVEVSLERALVKEANYALRVEFNPFIDSGWAIIKRMYPIPKDWSEASGISFWAYGDGSFDELAVMVTDYDNETYQVPWIRLGWIGWKRFYCDFDRVIRNESDTRKDGNSVFDQNGIKAISFMIRGGKSALIYLDDIGLTCKKEILHEPIGYASGIPSSGKVHLYWESSKNPFLIKYRVYRHGVLIGSTSDLCFTDFNVAADARYDYEVCAVYGDGKEGDKVKIKVATKYKYIPRKEKVEIQYDWIYVDGEKFFVKGIVYSPYRPGRDPRYDSPASLEILENDMKLIREGGFNTVRTWEALSERELILAEKYGLMVIQGLLVPENADFRDKRLLEYNRIQISEKVNWSRKYDNILYYILTSEPDPAAIITSGVDATSEFFGTLAKDVKRIDPDREVSLAYWELADYPQLPQFGVVSANVCRYGPVLNKKDTRYEDYIRWFKQTYAKDKPLVITEFGYSVSKKGYGPYGYGGNTLETQKEGTLEDLKHIIAGGATGACIFEWIDEWWKNLEYENDASFHDDEPEEWFGILSIKNENSDRKGTPRTLYYTLQDVFRSFVYYCETAIADSKYDHLATLKIKLDRNQYLSNQKMCIWFILTDKNGNPIRSTPITYYIIDTRGRVQTTFKATTGLRGIYKTKFKLPFNTEDTVISIFAIAYTKDGKHFANVKHVKVTENKPARGRIASRIKVISQPVLEIPRASERIIVDGKMEKAWDDAALLIMNRTESSKPILKVGEWSSDGDLSAKVRLLWNEENLYLFADATDDVPALNSNDGNDITDGDAIELFVGTDSENILEEGYSSGDFQIVFGANEKAWIFGQADGGIRNSSPIDSEVKVQKREDGYSLEARIAFKNFGKYDFSEGKELRFDIAIDDADEGSKSECQLVWNGSQKNFKDSKYWGRAKLVGAPK